MATAAPAAHAWYALRRTLPTWSFAENLQELSEVLPRYRVDELIVKIDTEEFTHGQPPLDWVQAYLPRLQAVRQAMDEIGVRYSLNPWITLGHCDRGRDGAAQLPGLQTMVGTDGTACTCCACPLSPVWRRHAATVWQLYAQTGPAVVWVEDDIRTFNHSPVRYGCFCPLHLERFATRVGRPAVQREELVAALLQPGPPHPWRGEFLDMQAEVMVETVAFLAGVVHRVSPETSLGLMSSGPRTHCLEGRRWQAFATALADGRPLYSRPPLGNYSEGSLRGLYYSHDSIKLTRHCLPVGTVEQTEVESVPFTRYSKSTAFTFLQLAVSFAYGSHGVTMNLFDHAGTPMETEPHYGAMLAARKPFLEALAARAQRPGRHRGVRLLLDQHYSYHAQLTAGADYGALAAPGAAMAQLLECHGLPTTYAAEPVTAAQGQQLRGCTDSELDALLAGGLLLDGTAATVLFQRGRGAEIGLTAIRPGVNIDRLGPCAAEEYHNPAFGGCERTYLTLTVPGLGGRPDLCVAELAPGAQEISRVVDPDATPRHPCMYAFENSRGGRVLVHLLDLDSAYGTAFNHPFRARQLREALAWASRDQLALVVEGGAYPLASRFDSGRSTLLTLFNLTLDPWDAAAFHLQDQRRIQRVEVLLPSGSWAHSGLTGWNSVGPHHTVQHRAPVLFDQPLCLTVTWDAEGD